MIPIKHILNENGVSEIFKLIVSSGAYTGNYIINKPVGWNQVDSIVDINDESLYVDNFIIADSNKLKFGQIDNPIAFNLLRDVYNEQKGDAKVVFKWIAEKDGIEYDLLKDNFEINFNKYSSGFGKSMQKIELEIIKSESQNKLLNREDITINLFSDKDLDDNDIDPVETFDIGYKKGDKRLSNFYTWDISQFTMSFTALTDQFVCFRRSDDLGFGNNINEFVGWRNNPSPSFGPPRTFMGNFVNTSATIKRLKVEIGNFFILTYKDDYEFPNVSLYAIVTPGNGGPSNYIKLEDAIAEPGTINGIPCVYGQIKIDFKSYDLGINLKSGEVLNFAIITNENQAFNFVSASYNTSIEIISNQESPLVRNKAVRLIDCLNKLVENYTESELSVISNILGVGGYYHNTSISTGVYLRGLPQVYLNQKIKTSFKSAFTDGAAKLMALGYDILDDKVVIEDINYFFKDYNCYDLSDKVYIQDGYSFDIDKDIIYNSMKFGSKKYSRNTKEDIKNFTTTAEFSTPIKSIKNKLDKETELIIDEFKIQELVEDSSTATNDNDDDLVLIDLVSLVDHWDEGVFDDCGHVIESGKLVLKCASVPFDTTLMNVGDYVTITEGLNLGDWEILSIDGFKLVLNKTSGIQEGYLDTSIRYKVSSLVKNRTNEGFTDSANIRNFDRATNIRHNPKYHMARWFPWFGSGMTKKLPEEYIKVTNYKNNSTAEMRINSADLANELQDLVIVGHDEPLVRMRDYKAPFFSGDKITISYNNVTFEEFINIYENWRYGEGNDRLKSRGYLKLNTPLGIYQVSPFGKEAFKHSKEKNILTINGKVKGKSVENPTLLSVVQIDSRRVTLTWDYIDEYVNPTSRVQYSLDGVSWFTLEEISNTNTATIDYDSFLDIITGTDVFFRVLVSSTDYLNVTSNTFQVVWQFNDWVARTLNKTENINCGSSYLTLELSGNADLELDWLFFSNPGGGSAVVTDLEDGSEVISFTSPYGSNYEESQATTLTLNNEVKLYQIYINSSNKTNDDQVLICGDIGVDFTARSDIRLTIKSNPTDSILKTIGVETVKKYLDN